MPFKKGKIANPTGKNGGVNYKAIFDEALQADCKKYRQHLIVKIIEMARAGDVNMCKSIIAKLLPDLKAVDMKLDGSSPFKLVIDMTPTSNNTKTHKSDTDYNE